VTITNLSELLKKKIPIINYGKAVSQEGDYFYYCVSCGGKTPLLVVKYVDTLAKN